MKIQKPKFYFAYHFSDKIYRIQADLWFGDFYKTETDSTGLRHLISKSGVLFQFDTH
jgi:hypothetical protein